MHSLTQKHVTLVTLSSQNVAVCLGAGSSENMVWHSIDLGIFSIRKRSGFDNEALTQSSENSAVWTENGKGLSVLWLEGVCCCNSFLDHEESENYVLYL